MYEIDNKDRVIKLNAPQSSVGAPIPILLADESFAVLAFYRQERDPDWNGKTVRIVGRQTDDLPIALITFKLYSALIFGPPNDEAFSGHPLATRGLKPYGAFEVENSSWIRKLERMNSVHLQHNPERFFQEKRHLIFSFHDSVFECIARDFEIEITRGSVLSMIPRMTEILRERDS
jgi:hypothetical protein